MIDCFSRDRVSQCMINCVATCKNNKKYVNAAELECASY